jgi:hypothetical protein
MGVIEKTYGLAEADRFCKSGKSGDGIGKTNQNHVSDSQNLRRPQKMRAPDPDAAWTLEPHVCASCFGRLVSQPATSDGIVRYRCTNCEAEAIGKTSAVLCACGSEVRRHGPSSGAADLGLRCRPNPSPSPEFPSAFVAVYVRCKDDN